MTKRSDVFICYSQKDQDDLQDFLTHLEPWRKRGLKVWWDRKIKAGQKWEFEIDKAIEASLVAVVFVTPNLLASNFVHDTELPALFAAEARGDIRLTWLFHEQCSIEDPQLTIEFELGDEKRTGRLADHQRLNSEPITSLSSSAEHNRALDGAAKEVRDIVAATSPTLVREKKRRKYSWRALALGLLVMIAAGVLYGLGCPALTPWETLDSHLSTRTWVPLLREVHDIEEWWAEGCMATAGLGLVLLTLSARRVLPTLVALAAVSVASAVAVFLGRTDLPRLVPEIPEYDSAVFEQITIRKIEPGRVIIGTPRHLVQKTCRNRTHHVRWVWNSGSEDKLTALGSSERWTWGSLREPLRCGANGWPRRSLVLIDGGRDGDKDRVIEAKNLARTLLDRGSADRVMIAIKRDWRELLDELVQVDQAWTGPDQLIVVLRGDPKDLQLPRSLPFSGALSIVASPDFDQLAEKLDFPGNRPLTSVWRDRAELLRSRGGTTLLCGGPEKHEEPIRDTGASLTFIKIPAGTFTMGPPGRQVPTVLPTYWISSVEVTNQHLGIVADGGAGADLPGQKLKWGRIEQFCGARYRLPTSAEWERAARGGSVTSWSFGDDEKDLDAYAWYAGNSRPAGSLLEADLAAHTVQAKLPNPIGLYDVHGNVAEWCSDRGGNDDATRPAVLIAPRGPEVGEERVLRGGSYADDAANTKSSSFLSMVPKPFAGAGFRCVLAQSPRER